MISKVNQFVLLKTAIFSIAGASTYALVVDDLDNGGQAAGVRTLLDQDDTANLNEAPLGSRDGRVTHFRRSSVCGGILIRRTVRLSRRYKEEKAVSRTVVECWRL